MNKGLIGACLVLILGAQLAAVAYFAGWLEPKPIPPKPRPPEEKPEEKLPSAAEREKALPAFFEDLGAALQEEDANRVAAHLDLDRMLEEMEQAVRRQTGALLPNLKHLWATELKNIAGRALSQQALLLPWARCAIEKVRPLKTRGEVRVDVRHRADDGSSRHMAWWLRYSRGGWHFYDWEDRELAERFSTTVALLSKRDIAEVGTWAPAALKVQQAEHALAKNDLARASAALARVGPVKFPAHIAARRWLLAGTLALRQGQPSKALKHFDKARAARGPLPILNRLRARASLALGECDKALMYLDRYARLLGDDAETHRQRGIALAGLGQLPSALDSFRKAALP